MACVYGSGGVPAQLGAPPLMLLSWPRRGGMTVYPLCSGDDKRPALLVEACCVDILQACWPTATCDVVLKGLMPGGTAGHAFV